MHHIHDLQKQTNANYFQMQILKISIQIMCLLLTVLEFYLVSISTANIAYIGGGFGSGIHNILEAVTFGLPVIFGPNYQKFNEATRIDSIRRSKKY